MRLLLGIVGLGIALGLAACKRPAEVDAGAGGADAGPSPVASASTAPIAPAALAAPDPCFVTDRAERSDLNRCYPDTLPESEWDIASSVELTASPATVTNTPGGIGDLVVHYANKTNAPVVLVFDDSPLRGHVVAHHADGRRADGTDAPPPAWARSWAHGVKRHQRVVLGPRAVLDERKMWFASSWSWAPNAHEKQYPRSLLGPLPKGSYALRVRTPLVVRSKGDRVDYAEASTGARVE
jgi:hypothetical protein